MRKSLMAGNWKMNLDSQGAYQLARDIMNETKEFSDREVLICPPFIYLEKMKEQAKDSFVKIGAQNICWKEDGAYTGEISGEMLKSINIDFVILGHSERREYLNEDNLLLAEKIGIALKNEIDVIYCVGEKLKERESGIEKEVVETQISEGLFSFTKEQLEKLVIAYEPVWAIGTGKTATPEQAQDMHKFIRLTLEKEYGKEFSDRIRILYGGSVKPDNVDELMAKEDIDGALVGGASLKKDSFMRIVNYQ